MGRRCAYNAPAYNRAMARIARAHSAELLPSPPGFDFVLTVESHGWFDLPPFRYDRERRVLDLAFHANKEPATLRIRPAGGGLHLSVSPRRALDLARGVASTILRLDENLSEFHALLASDERLRWAAERRAGRLLRAPTAFEDSVKYLCTTNCSWALTRRMVSNLVEQLGDPAPMGLRTFPRPEAMAARPVSFYRDRIRCGYRAPFLVEFARRVASGAVDPESWRASRLSSAELRMEILGLKGFGPYAAESLLRLCGRYDFLGIDSWCRAVYSREYGRGRSPADSRMRRRYRRFGRWQGLAMWLDVTRHWHESGGPPEWNGRGG